MIEAARLVILAAARTEQAERSLTRLNKQFIGTKTSGQQMAGTLASMGAKIALVGGALGIVSTVMASKFQTALFNLEAHAGASAQEVGFLHDKLLELSPSLGYGPTQLANAIYHLESNGLRGAVAIDALTASAKLAQVGQAKLEDTTNALLGVMMSGIGGIHSWTDAAAQTNAVIGIGNMRLKDWIGVISTGVIPVAANLGLKFQDIGSAIATLADVGGGRAQQWSMRLRTALTMAAAPTKAAIASLNSLGMSQFQLATDMRTGGLLKMLKDLRDHMKGLSETQKVDLLGSMFGRSRSSTPIIILMRQLGLFQQKLGQVSKLASEFGDNWKRVQETFQFRSRAAMASLQVLAVTIGEMLLPTMMALVTDVQRVVTWFNRLPGPIKGTVVALGAFLVVGSGVAVIGLRVFSMIKILSAGMVAFRTTTLMTTIATTAFGSAALGLVGSLTAVGATLTVLGLGFGVAKQSIKDNVSMFDELRHQLGFHVKGMKDASTATDGLSNTINTNIKATTDAILADQLYQQTLAGMKKTLQDLQKEYSDTVKSISDQIAAYDGLISKSKFTARSVIKDLTTETANYRTFAKDVKTLIRDGVGRDALGWLEQKGPQYVHGLAVGSHTQLEIFKKDWKDHGRAIKDDFASSMAKQLADLKAKIRDMNAQIRLLEGKTVPVNARASVTIADSVKGYLAAAGVKGFHAEGDVIRKPQVAVVGEGKAPETIIPWDPAHRSRAMRLWTYTGKQLGVPGLAEGGMFGRDLRGQFYNPVVKATGVIGQEFVDNLASMIGKGLTKALATAVAGLLSGGPLGPASGNVITLALAQAKRMHASFKVALALMEAGIVESGLRNLNYGDRDSLGFLQQRPSQGWLHPMNITYAAWDFLRRAIPIAGRYGTAGQLAQAVQRSAFPARYDAVQSRALSILNAYKYDQGGWIRELVIGRGTRSGKLYSFGEREDELVTPKSRTRSGALGGHTINLSIVVQGDVRDTATLNDIEAALQQFARHLNNQLAVGVRG